MRACPIELWADAATVDKRRCQEAVAAGVLGAEELVDELLLESLDDDDVEVDSFLLEESLELASLLVEVDRLSLR